MLSLILFLVISSFSYGKNIFQRIKYLVISILLLLLLWGIMPIKSQNRFETIWMPEAGPVSAQSSAQGRVTGLAAGITMFERFPITGVGIGNFIAYRVQHVDGIPLQSHSLYGQLLGETGFIGFSAFFLMILAIFATIAKVNLLAKKQVDPTLDILKRLTLACRDSLILLFFSGLFGHNLLRFNWLWIAAFCSLALFFTKQHMKDLKANETLV
jgi:O-antigen ligase